MGDTYQETNQLICELKPVCTSGAAQSVRASLENPLLAVWFVFPSSRQAGGKSESRNTDERGADRLDEAEAGEESCCQGEPLKLRVYTDVQNRSGAADRAPVPGVTVRVQSLE